MTSASIRRRRRGAALATSGGRAHSVHHGGSFRTEREARARRDFIAGELAVGRNPADPLRVLTDPPIRRSLAEWGAAWAESPVDVAEATLQNYRKARLRSGKSLGKHDPHTLTPAGIQGIGPNADLRPGSRQFEMFPS